MRQDWEPEDLIEVWTLLDREAVATPRRTPDPGAVRPRAERGVDVVPRRLPVPACVRGHSADNLKRKRALADEAFPEEKQIRLVALVADATSGGEAAAEAA